MARKRSGKKHDPDYLRSLGIPPDEFARLQAAMDRGPGAYREAIGWPEGPAEPGRMWMHSHELDCLVLHLREHDQEMPEGMAEVDARAHHDIFSLATFARRWGWKRSRVRRFVRAIIGGEEPPSRPIQSGRVYFVGRADNVGPVKIGFTIGDPEKRVAELQTGHPYPLTVYHAVEGTPRMERKLHAQLKAHRLQGEWFEREAALRLLASLKSEER